MRRSFFSQILDYLLCALLVSAWPGATAASTLAVRSYCSAGRALRGLTISYARHIPAPPSGTPLDAALRSEQVFVERARQEARSAFLSDPPAPLGAMMDDYTFLIPEAMKESFSIGSLIGVTEITAAIRYHSLLWREVIERYTTVREAYSEDPYVLRFEVSLDLGFFCRYGRRIRNLVTR